MILGTNRRRIQGVVPLRRGDARRVPIPYAQHVNRDRGDPTGTPNVSTALQHRGWMQRAACRDVGKRPIFVQDQATERHTPGSVVITISHLVCRHPLTLPASVRSSRRSRSGETVIGWACGPQEGSRVSTGRWAPIMPSLAAYPAMMQRDRKRVGLRVCRAAWLVGVTVREYREMEAGDRAPTPDAYGRICELYGWPRGFIGADATPNLRVGAGEDRPSSSR
jgi:hypothetical protein